MRFLLGLANDLTRLTPGEVVHVPVCVSGKHQIPNGDRKQINQHPTDICDLAGSDDDEDTRKTENESEQYERNDRLGHVCDRLRQDGDHENVEGETDGGGKHEGTDEVHKDDKLHREAECTAQVTDQHELEQVVNGRIDPSSSLREQDSETFRHDRLAYGLRAEHHLSLRERLEHECREVSVFTKEEKILLVKRIDNVFRVVFANVRIGKDRYPVTAIAFRRLDTVH